MKEKKKWVKPELVVLVRRKPEEGIMTNCKQSGGNAAQKRYDGCSNPVWRTCISCKY